jgi:hypothetical protein
MGAPVLYQDNGYRPEGYLAVTPSAVATPGILLVPTWLNVCEPICKRADRLPELGYAVFVTLHSCRNGLVFG